MVQKNVSVAEDHSKIYKHGAKEIFVVDYSFSLSGVIVYVQRR
jgi:hypothetical protein